MAKKRRKKNVNNSIKRQFKELKKFGVLTRFRDIHHTKWANSVKRRDNYTCQYPGCKSKHRVQAHHIRKWADAVLFRYDINNGICLCKVHHNMVTGYEEFYQTIFLLIIQEKNK